MRFQGFKIVKGTVAGEAGVDVAVVFRHWTGQLDAVRRQHVLFE